MAILIYAEHDNSMLGTATRNVVTAAQAMAKDGAGGIHILIAGENARGPAEQAAKIPGIAKVLLADNAAYGAGLAEAIAPLLVHLAPSYSHLLAAATTTGKNVMPRAAALLDVSQVSDISAVVSADTFVRPIYAGNALATVKSNDNIKIVTVRGASFSPVTGEGGPAPIETVSGPSENALSRFVTRALSKSERPELTVARVIVSGGRGVGSKENFRLIEDIADKLGAAVGASRAAVDAGYISNDSQVGQTGKIVAPDLYIAVGISGAIQHYAGMKDAKVIVAINKDAEAPIFGFADYGLVGDLFTILPELSAELAKK